jgi:hypothetical protein
MRRITSLVLLLALLPTTAWAVQTTIKVNSPAGPPVGNATLQIFNTEGEMVAEEESDDDGTVIVDLPDGEYMAQTIDGRFSVRVSAGEIVTLVASELYGFLRDVDALTDYFESFEGGLEDYAAEWNLLDPATEAAVDDALGARLSDDWDQFVRQQPPAATQDQVGVRSAAVGTVEQAELAAVISKIFEVDDGTTLAEKTAEFVAAIDEDPAAVAARVRLQDENTRALAEEAARQERLAALDQQGALLRKRLAIDREWRAFRREARADGIWTQAEIERDDELTDRWTDAWTLTPEEEARAAELDDVRQQVLQELTQSADALDSEEARKLRLERAGYGQALIDLQKIEAKFPWLARNPDGTWKISEEDIELHLTVTGEEADRLIKEIAQWREALIKAENLKFAVEIYLRRTDITEEQREIARQIYASADLAMFAAEDAMAMDFAVLLMGLSIDGALTLAGGPAERIAAKVAKPIRGLFGRVWTRIFGEATEQGAQQAGRASRPSAPAAAGDEVVDIGQGYFDKVADEGAAKAKELGIPDDVIEFLVTDAKDPRALQGAGQEIARQRKMGAVRTLSRIAQWDARVARARSLRVPDDVIQAIQREALEDIYGGGFHTAYKKLAAAEIAQAEGGLVMNAVYRYPDKVLTDFPGARKAWMEQMGEAFPDDLPRFIDVKELRGLIDAFDANGGKLPTDLTPTQEGLVHVIADMADDGAKTVFWYDDLEQGFVKLADENFVNAAKGRSESMPAIAQADVPPQAGPGFSAESPTILEPPPDALPGGRGFRDAPTELGSSASGAGPEVPSGIDVEAPTAIDSPGIDRGAPTVLTDPGSAAGSTPSPGVDVEAPTAPWVPNRPKPRAPAVQDRVLGPGEGGVHPAAPSSSGSSNRLPSGTLVPKGVSLGESSEGTWHRDDGGWQLQDSVTTGSPEGFDPVIVYWDPDMANQVSPFWNGFVMDGVEVDGQTMFFGYLPADRLDELVASPAIESDSTRVKEVRDPYFRSAGSWGQDGDDQWAIKRVGFTWDRESAWRASGAGEHEVVVAIIDSGLNWHHPDLNTSQIWRNPGEIPGNQIDDDENGFVDDIIGWNFVSNTNMPWDRDGHGTFVTGLIAARTNNGVGIAGINPRARIMVLKAVDDQGQTRASFLTRAIIYAADNGARVINLSVGGPTLTRAEQLAVDYAHSKGVLVVAAAGNAGVDVTDYSPAGLDNVLTVAATGYDDLRAPFSNWGQGIDIAAPGVDVLSLRAAGTNLAESLADESYDLEAAIVGPDRAYFRASGTSFAVPIVTGVASLRLSNSPQLGPDDLERLLEQAARDTEVPGFDSYTGHGIVDARAALTADPTFFIEAAIFGVGMAQKDGKPVVAVSGSATANQFSRAWMEVGVGDDPSEWSMASDPIVAPVKDGTVGEIPVHHFQGAKRFTLRLIVQHANGRQREARFTLDLG